MEIRKWWNRLWKDPYTVAADVSPFWSPWNTHEQLFRFNGIVRAKFFMYRWVRKYPCGQARLLTGWEYSISDLITVAKTARDW